MKAVELRAIAWDGEVLRVLDQRALTERETWLEYRRVEEVAEAIREMVVRGAPAIGIAAAYGVALAAARAKKKGRPMAGEIAAACELLAATRPTAVNLFWALEQARALGSDDPAAYAALARRIHDDDIAGNRRIGA